MIRMIHTMPRVQRIQRVQNGGAGLFAALRMAAISVATFLLFFGFSVWLFAQEEPEGGNSKRLKNSKNLKRSFIGIELGQTIAVSRKESGDMPEGYPYFLYDLYALEIQEGGGQETLWEVQGSGFVEKGVFQFGRFGAETGGETRGDEPVLISITIFLDAQWSSYQQLFQKFYQDYGDPLRLSPSRSIWQDEETFVSLEKQVDERPRYKIVDRRYLDGLRAETQENSGLDQQRYEEFLQKF